MEIDLERSGNDLRELPGRLRSQVCIVGGGIAGLLLAERLSSRFTVTVLEAGGSGSSDHSDPFAAELRERHHLGTSEGRMRAFGGCSLTWGGQLLGLPEDAGWPVDLAGYDGGDADWHVPQDTAAFLTGHGAEVPALLAGLPRLTPRLARFVSYPRRNLARDPGRKLLASECVKVVLHAPVREVLLAETRDRVVGVEVCLPAGGSFRVEADQFVLAAGTVETCRLLLASRRVASEGIGNAHDQVGRNFSDHLTVTAAVFTGAARTSVLKQWRPWVLPSPEQRRSVYSLKLEASAELRAELGLHRTMAHLTVEEPVGSALGTLREWLRARQSGMGKPAVVSGLPKIAVQAFRLGWEAQVRRRRYVSPAARVQLQINGVQDAPSSSRVYLKEGCEAGRMPGAVVDWRISDAEVTSLRLFTAYLKERFEAMGLGDGMSWEASLLSKGDAMDRTLLEKLDDARHAMGGACMGTDPRSSVVDTELRVHGICNLSLASPAVFPDGSPQLPTVTLRALCMRLADRLGRELA